MIPNLLYYYYATTTLLLRYYYATTTLPLLYYYEVVDHGTKGDPHATDMGILVNHAYTLLDVREVGEPYQDSTKARLLKLRNPWGDGEWKGPWSDDDAMWRTPLGARALQTLGVTFEDDGTFWLSWEDFQAHFNKVYVVRVVDSVDGTAAGAAQRATPEQWFRYELEADPNPNPDLDPDH